MSYLHIQNLYKDRHILLFKEVYALEKIHGTSAHIRFNNGEINFFGGSVKHATFLKIFDIESLKQKFIELGVPVILIYGEAYGGKLMGMKASYGDTIKFIAFDVMIDGKWLAVPKAEQIVKTLGLEFVHYVTTSTDLAALDILKEAPSQQAIRNGCGSDKKQEGVVLRPLEEMRTNNDERVIAKYKRQDFEEIKGPRPLDEAMLKVLSDANEIATEWVTENRLTNILSHIPEEELIISNMKTILNLMYEDIKREAKGEIVDSREVKAAIGKATALIFKNRLKGE